jgi:3-oxoacyl-[acyl-carrier protein] reductase
MWERTVAEIAAATNSDPESVFAARSANVPLKRYGTADEVAALILFLVSPYGRYLNGVTIDVDGGFGTHVY